MYYPGLVDTIKAIASSFAFGAIASVFFTLINAAFEVLGAVLAARKSFYSGAFALSSVFTLTREDMKSLRIKNSKLIFILDFIKISILSVAFGLLVYALFDGQIRAYAILFSILGFAASSNSVSKAVHFILVYLASVLTRLCLAIAYFCVLPQRALVRKLCKIVKKVK